jgi:hypothetical protein
MRGTTEPRRQISPKFVYLRLVNENKKIRVTGDDGEWPWTISQK